MNINAIDFAVSPSTGIVCDDLSNNEPQSSSEVSGRTCNNDPEENSPQNSCTTNITIYIDEFESDERNKMDMIYCIMCFTVWIILLSFYLPTSIITIYFLIIALIGVFLSVSVLSLEREEILDTAENCKRQTKHPSDTLIMI